MTGAPEDRPDAPNVADGCGIEEERALEPQDVLRFLLRNARPVLAAAVTAAVLAGFWVAFFEPTLYRATSILLLPPEQASSIQLPPRESYLQIASARAHLEATRQQLAEEGLLGSSSPLRLGREMERTLQASDMSNPRSTANSILKLTATLTDPKAAESAVNLWADSIVEHSNQLLGSALNAELESLKQERREAEKQVEQLTVQRDLLKREREQARRDAVDRWETEIHKHHRHRIQSETAYNIETEKLKRERQERHRLATRTEALHQLLEAYGERRKEQAGLNRRLALARQRLTALDLELKQLEPTPRLQKAPGSCADITSTSEAGGIDQRLVNEQPNPVYLDLQRSRAYAAVRADLLQNQHDGIEADLERMHSDLQELEREVLEGNLALDLLRLERESGLEQLGT